MSCTLLPCNFSQLRMAALSTGGLCTTWTLDSTGIWTGLWTGLGWTDQNRQQTPPRLQQLVSSSASSCFLAAEASSSWYPRSQKSHALLKSNNDLQLWSWMDKECHSYFLHFKKKCWSGLPKKQWIQVMDTRATLCWSLLNMHVTWQSWRQAVVVLVVFAVCMLLFWSVRSSVHSSVHSPVHSPFHRPVQSRIHVL